MMNTIYQNLSAECLCGSVLLLRTYLTLSKRFYNRIVRLICELLSFQRERSVSRLRHQMRDLGVDLSSDEEVSDCIISFCVCVRNDDHFTNL